MIKLVVITSAHSTTPYSFDCSSVIIGAKNSPVADLALPDESLQHRHLQIIENDNIFFVINLANDPFVSLNGLPFGKQPIKENDCIQIGNSTIRVESISKFSQKKSDALEKSKQEDVLSQQEIEALVRQVEAMALPKIEIPQKNPSIKDRIKIETVTKQVQPEEESIAIEKDPKKSSDNKLSALPSPHAPKLSLKDYYLSEYDEENHASHPIQGIQNAAALDHENGKRWRRYLKFPLISACFIAIIMGLIFLWLSDQSGEEEIKAARSVSDVAMALTHAQIQNIHPQNQNWSDPEFIKNNLTAVLASEYSSLADFDSHGQFACCNYMLRIYTSSNLSQFLVIAQPAPSLLHWIVPKATIIIDSQAMEMRKTQDLKTLNRLLVNANTLDVTNAGEISNIVKQGELITLNQLCVKNEKYGFTPPKALALLHPNAENLVYNAPRYYSLGQNLIKKALELMEKLVDSHEVNLFLQELSALSKYPNLILYSTEGLEHAILSQKALATLAPEEKFLFAYLQINAKGKITGSHLLMDDPAEDIAIREPTPEYSLEKSLFNALGETKDNSADNFAITGALSNEETQLNEEWLDRENPVFLHLSALASFRQQALKPLSDEMITLLNKQTHTPQIDFYERIAKLLGKYKEVSEEQRTKVANYIGTIARGHTNIPASIFVEFVNAAGIRPFLEDYLISIKNKKPLTEAANQDLLNKMTQQIDLSSNWVELENQTVQSGKELQFDNVPDIGLLISYQSKVRSQVIQKLNQFLLSSDHSLPSHAFTHEDRGLLINILRASWIIDRDTYEFYTGEFELRMNQAR